MSHPDHAAEIRQALHDPRKLVEALGLADGAQRNGSGVIVRCPAHGGVSCSVTQGPDGTVRVKCFGCDLTGDALTLIAVARGLELRGDGFREVLREAATIAGLWAVVHELDTGSAPANRPRTAAPLPPPEPERDFAPAGELLEVWNAAGPVDDDGEASGALVARRIDPVAVARANLLRVVHSGAVLPPWARFRGQGWGETGHRILARVWGAQGAMVSLRGWRVRPGTDAPKRLPPAGHRCSSHVLANRPGVGVLLGATGSVQRRVVVVEGEPDWLQVSLALPGVAVLGVGSGWWSQEIADRIPRGWRVDIATHRDAAGDKYAQQVIATLGNRCPAWRTRWAT